MELDHASMESARFGVEVWRARGSGEALNDLRRVAIDRRADLVIVRCDASDWAGVHAVERAGALLMDTHLSLERAPGPVLEVAPGDFFVRTARVADVGAVADLARSAFVNYGGHFHADPRLAPQATEVYEDWAVRSVTDPATADVVLVCEDEYGAIAGFTTLRLDGDTAVGVLDAVAPRAQGRGVYRVLGRARLEEASRRGVRRIVVRTHLVNVGARRGLARLGFLPSAQEHTFHLWTDAYSGRRSAEGGDSSRPTS